MIFNQLTPKQKKIFRWCHGANKDKYDAIMCDGAVRSGKTVCMIASYILWAMRYFNGCYFGICGKTVSSAERNIINPLLDMEDIKALYSLNYKRVDNCLVVSDGNTQNHFYVFGGKDESSATLIQGMTLAGVFLDEAVNMPRSFVEQAIARCSVEGSKIWFSCNPQGPSHWLKTEWIDKADEKKLYRLQFRLTDNPTLAKSIVDRYERTYTGVFYKRFVLGEWAVADGLVYDVDPDDITTDALPDSGRYFISIDYGTLNPFAALLWCINGGVAYCIDEYYYSGRDTNRQLTDEEYYKELERLAGNKLIEDIVIDPSAASMIATIRRHGKYSVRKANNDVIDGIRVTSALLKNGQVKAAPKCTGLLKEIGLYSWDDKKQTDTVKKENDHAMDAMRYFCYTVLRHEWNFMSGGVQ